MKTATTCTETVPSTSCPRVPHLLTSTSKFATMPRPVALSTSPATITPSTGFAAHQLHLCTRQGHDRATFLRPLFSYSYELLFPQSLYFDNHLSCPGVSPLPPVHQHESRVTSHRSRRFTLLRTLFLSSASFFDSRRLFSMPCALFCKIPGVSVSRTVLRDTRGLQRFVSALLTTHYPLPTTHSPSSVTSASRSFGKHFQRLPRISPQVLAGSKLQASPPRRPRSGKEKFRHERPSLSTH